MRSVWNIMEVWKATFQVVARGFLPWFLIVLLFLNWVSVGFLA